jgi:uncharacterized protein with NAD-binding domain and iron-sulfur cluster
MAGLTAAWELSRPGWRDQFESITVYQRGGRLGGKGASSRGVHGRIEEHGLHVWLGYYHNAFRLMREVYAELDRAHRDPSCPIRTFDDAFVPSDVVGVGQHGVDGWTTWTGRFERNDREPGAGDLTGRALTVADFVRHATQLVTALIGSLASMPKTPRSRRPGVFLTGSPAPPAATASGGPFDSLGQLRGLLGQAELGALVAGIHSLTVLERVAPRGSDTSTSIVLGQLATLRGELERRARASEAGLQLSTMVDLLLGCVQGAIEDGLLVGDGFARIDHLDFREWLAPRVRPETLSSPFITGLYDLVFAYEHGEHDRPRFAAGLGLFLAGRLFFEYRGSIFRKMRAGMGDVVFAPLYQALSERGVRFEFFHRLDRLELTDDGRAVRSLRFGRQAQLADPDAVYDPLVIVAGLPCFPTDPWSAAFRVPPAPEAESIWSDRSHESSVVKRAGEDFDVVVLAVSLGMIPHVAPTLAARPPWPRLLDSVATVATESLQVWLRPSEVELGWSHPGATVSGFSSPFDTYSSMSHLIDAEQWPAGCRPSAIGYFCSALPDRLAREASSARAAVAKHVAEFLSSQVERVWPYAATDTGGLRSGVLMDDAVDLDDAGDGFYFRANVDPSDRYVQSLPGSGVHRLQVDQSGVHNLVLAGDWTNCGLNAGCVEAAVMSGLEAANVVAGRPLTMGVAGRWYGLDEQAGRMGAVVDGEQGGREWRNATG